MTTYDTLAQLLYNGSYNVLPDLVEPNPGVSLERGVSDDLDIRHGVCTFRLRDDADLYRPSNAASALYGQTGPWMRGAFSTGGSVRFTGEAQYMTPGETSDHRASGGVSVRGKRWVDVRLGGTLARVGEWRDPVTPPLTTLISRAYSTARGYWPLTDGKSSTSLANLAYPTRVGTGAGLTFEADGPSGSPLAIEMQSGGTITLPVAAMSPLAGFQVSWGSRITTTDATRRDTFTFRTSSGYTYRWQIDSTGYGLLITDALGATVVNDAWLYGAGAESGWWISPRLKVYVSGSNIVVDAAWYPEQSGVIYLVSSSFAGSAAIIGAPTALQVPATAATTGARYSQVLVTTGVTDDLLSGEFTAAFNGYARELAADRFTRLCTARGLPYVVRGTTSLTARLGAQRLLTMLDQLKEIRRSEAGLIFDRGDNRGVVLATRDYLYSQAAAPVLDLVWPDDFTGQLAEVSPALFNIITVANEAGSTSTAELATTRQGTQSPPSGSGRLDKKVEVNVGSDGQLPDLASWWLAFYTQAGPSFGTLTVDVDAVPSRLAACNAAEPGMFARVTGRTPDPVLLLILSTAQGTHRHRNVFTFSVCAGAIFDVVVWDDTGSRWDSASTTLAADITSSATSATLATTNYFDTWSTTETPYDVAMAGERITVTAMTAPTFTSGAWRQTATITRAVNGVSKAQVTGAGWQLADPVYWG
jgi:hypothetical protein